MFRIVCSLLLLSAGAAQLPAASSVVADQPPPDFAVTTHPEQFYPKINPAWQREQLAQERKDEKR